MGNQKVLVSVIITTFNRKDLLKKALLNLDEQALGRDLFEVIVVDDGSTDGTSHALSELKPALQLQLKIFRQSNLGPSSARNLGIKNASADIIAFHDDDITVPADWLGNALACFKDESVSGVEGKTIVKGVIKPFTHCVSNEHGGIFLGCNIFYRKDILDKAGGFDENIRQAFGDDYDMALRILALGGKIIFCKDVIATHVVSPLKAISVIKRAALSQWIPYLFKKHGEKIRPFLGFRIQRVLISIFFIIFIDSLARRQHLPAIIGLAGMAAFTMFLEKSHLNTKNPLIFLKALLVYMTANAFAFFMFLYGCLKYKVMPDIKMFRR